MEAEGRAETEAAPRPGGEAAAWPERLAAMKGRELGPLVVTLARLAKGQETAMLVSAVVVAAVVAVAVVVAVVLPTMLIDVGRAMLQFLPIRAAYENLATRSARQPRRPQQGAHPT